MFANVSELINFNLYRKKLSEKLACQLMCFKSVWPEERFEITFNKIERILVLGFILSLTSQFVLSRTG